MIQQITLTKKGKIRKKLPSPFETTVFCKSCDRVLGSAALVTSTVLTAKLG
jgi:hypothetical protein